MNESETSGTHSKNLLRRIWGFIYRKKKPNRTVLLVMFDGDIMIADAIKTHSGWMAQWIRGDDTWSLLLPGGKVMGTRVVKAWMPHSGWEDEEQSAKPCNL